MAGMPAQVAAAGAPQPALLVHIDGGGGRCESAEFAKPDFDENDGHTIEHDEVDLSVPAAEIPLEQLETIAQQVIEGQLFGTTPYGLLV